MCTLVAIFSERIWFNMFPFWYFWLFVIVFKNFTSNIKSTCWIFEYCAKKTGQEVGIFLSILIGKGLSWYLNLAVGWFMWIM